VLPYVDLALLTVDDEQALFHFSDCAAVFGAYEQIGTPEVVLKRGAEACLIRCEVSRSKCRRRKSSVVDTTAAGIRSVRRTWLRGSRAQARSRRRRRGTGWRVG
jgi:2-dehydro-3-deoxygluconokinase